MTSAAWTDGLITGGVDTHGDTHHAAVIDQVGRHRADEQFPATPAGYRQLLEWLGEHVRVQRVGMEGTGAYGAALTRFLRERGVAVVEADRPDRKARRTRGKSAPIDAYAAARAALSGAASGDQYRGSKVGPEGGTRGRVMARRLRQRLGSIRQV